MHKRLRVDAGKSDPAESRVRPQEDVLRRARSAVGAAAEERGIYRLLVDTVRDYAIFAIGPAGHILTWNAGAQRIKGYTEEEIIGRHFSIFYPAADLARDKPGMELREAARVGRFEDEDWRVRKDGSLFWANVVITALHNDAGELVGFAKVTRDLTERRKAQERALEDARRIAEVEAANRAKTEFLTALSHELRTPLNAIGGFTELLMLGLRGPVTADQRQDLERIRRNQQHLLGLINDLLNFSRIDAGRLRYNMSEVPLDSMLASVPPMIAPQAFAKSVSLERGACDRGAVAWADRAKVEQILLNLLSNAVKFTDPGGTITTSCGRAGEDVELRVADTGIGIEADLLESIFEPFVQVGRSLTTMHEGTGLGLAISRELARGMGGDLVVESVPGSGSTFTLRLPSALGRA
jgi:PAS domain S-box-containing protein